MHVIALHHTKQQHTCCREEPLQQVPGQDAALNSRQQQSGQQHAEPAWMMHTEVQTCAMLQSPLWADEQFSFLELQSDLNESKASGSSWLKVHTSEANMIAVQEFYCRCLHSYTHAVPHLCGSLLALPQSAQPEANDRLAMYRRVSAVCYLAAEECCDKLLLLCKAVDHYIAIWPVSGIVR